ncbi:MAG: hypothetical protein MUE68_12315 [Bacteroidetes bacterium]|nr:hypothetical protein [Bacteroidota bacterium]
MRHRTILLIAACALGALGLIGCIDDEIDMVYLEFDSPVVQPALSLPADPDHSSRISFWLSKPVVTRRDGFFDRNDGRSVNWTHDTIAGPGGIGSYVIQRRTSHYQGPFTRLRDTHWDLPSIQGGGHFEFSVTNEVTLGFGGQWASGVNGTTWLAEARLSTDIAAEAPQARFSLGGFLGRHTVRAAYLRQVEESVPIVSWADGRQSTDGYFGELVLGPSAHHRGIAGFAGVTVVYQHLLTHAVPAPDPRVSTSIVNEWQTVWTLTMGLRVPLSAATDLIVAPRLVIDQTIETTYPATFLMPHVQVNVRL